MEMTPGEPQSATDYDDRTTAAVKSVLVEIGQILGAFKGRFAVIGGAVPWLLLVRRLVATVGREPEDGESRFPAEVQERAHCSTQRRGRRLPPAKQGIKPLQPP